MHKRAAVVFAWELSFLPILNHILSHHHHHPFIVYNAFSHLYISCFAPILVRLSLVCFPRKKENERKFIIQEARYPCLFSLIFGSVCVCACGDEPTDGDPFANSPPPQHPPPTQIYCRSLASLTLADKMPLVKITLVRLQPS